jgi:hypothetical protein
MDLSLWRKYQDRKKPLKPHPVDNGGPKRAKTQACRSVYTLITELAEALSSRNVIPG